MIFSFDVWTAPFPLQAGGGAIVLGAGAGVLLSLFRRDLFVPIFLTCFGLGFASIYAFGLAVPVDAVSRLQLAAFLGSVGLEAVLIGAVLVLIREPRRQILAILAAVSLHFVPMGLAVGPLMTALGACGLINIALAFAAPRYGLGGVLAVDGLLKLGFGAAMLLGAGAAF